MVKNKADVLVYRALKKAVEKDQLRIYLDYGKINRPASPVYNPWECLLPLLIPVLIGLVLILLVGVVIGLLFIIAMVIVYSFYFKKRLHRNVLDRTKEQIIKDLESCQSLWDFGGIVFVNKDNKKMGCVSPDGDWKGFVVKNFSEYMIEKKEPEKKEEKKHESPRARRRQ